MAACQSLNRYALKWIKSFLRPIFSTVKVQVVRNCMNFITCQKSWSWQFSLQFGCRMIAIYRISTPLARTFRDNFLYEFASVGGRHVLVTYSVHFGGMSSAYMFWAIYHNNGYMASVRNLLINLAQVIILEHFLQWYTVFRSLIHEFL
jgi:hypothetical protein